MNDNKNSTKLLKNIYKIFNTENPYKLYSLLFGLLSIVILILLNINGLSLIYKGDALSQHFPSQFFLNKAINDIFFNFGRGIDTFNFKLGFGNDTLFTYYHYGLFDPLNIIMIPLRNVNPITVYSIRIFLRLYIAGISFIFMCRYFISIRSKTKSTEAISIGAIIYVFSNYAISSGVTHPYFAYSMILMPFMVVGATKLIRENKKTMFIFTSFLSIIINFYFAYIIAFQILLYAFVDVLYFTKGEKFRVKASIKLFFRGIYSYLIAVLLSACVIFPMIYGITNSIRNNSITINIPIITQTHLLFRYFFDFFKIPKAGDAVTAGIAIITLFTLFLLFYSSGRKQLKILCIIALLAVFLPKFQSAMTGFSYANYRWTFVVELLISYIFADKFDELTNIKVKENKKLIYSYFIYISVYILYAVYLFTKKSYPEAHVFAILDMSGVIVFLIYIFILISEKISNKRKFLVYTTILTMCISMCVYVEKAAISGVLAKKSNVEAMINNKELMKLAKDTENTFIRIDNNDVRSMNFSDIYGYNSSSVYYSIENKNLSQFNLDMNNSKAAPVTNMNNMDSRVALDNLMSVKYYVGEHKIPFGYEKTNMDTVYKNKNFIPFGFTYDSYIEYDKVKNLSSLDLQELMLNTCLVEGYNFKRDQDSIDKDKISADKDKVDIYRDEINIDKFDIETFKSRGNIFNKLSIDKSASGKVKTKKKYNLKINIKSDIDGELYMKLPSQDSFKNMNNIIVKVDGIESRTNFTKKNTRWYSGETNSVINLGYMKKGNHEVSINIPKGVAFDTNDIEFEIRDINYVENSAKKLSQEYLKEININSSSFSGKIDVSKNKILFISIPYGDSWKAFVDGKETKIIKANIGFMGVYLEKGVHNIRFEYTRPYQRISLIISLTTVLILVLHRLYIHSRKSYKKTI